MAARYGLRVDYVANSRMTIPDGELLELVVVGRGNLDAADDWIAERFAERDIVVSSVFLSPLVALRRERACSTRKAGSSARTRSARRSPAARFPLTFARSGA